MRRIAAINMLMSIVVGACATTPFPDDARQALESYWDSLPSGSEIEFTLVRGWEGEPTSIGPDEVWCVEAEATSDDLEVDGTVAKWIVMRSAGETEWSVSMLATMSSLWPYEACGLSPGESSRPAT